MSRYSFDAVIFDLDGVITKTALVHATAWKEMFDEYLRDREKKFGEPFKEFTHTNDYLPYVDGKPRYKGVESFLQSRGINIPFGTPDDDSNMETVCGLGNRKNNEFNKILKRDGVEVYKSTVAFIDELEKAGIKLGVASSSKNCKQVLEVAKLAHRFETRVDGEVSAELGLHGKPEADIFTVACDNLGVTYDRAVIVEDAVSGVQAGRNGNFGLVLGIARENNTHELKSNGADIVVTDISEINGIEGVERWFKGGLLKDLWAVSYNDYKPENERSREALLTVGNGYFGTRGALEESESNPVNYPGTYMAGLYNKLSSPVGDRMIENEDFVNAPNWLTISFKVGEGDWFDPNKDKILEIERNLNMLTGVLTKKMVVEDSKGHKTKIESRRIASMSNKHHAAIDYSITPINYGGYIRIKSGLSVPPINDGVERYKQLNQKHTEPVESGGTGNTTFIAAKTVQSSITIALAAKLEAFFDNRPLATDFVIKHDEGWVNTYIKASVKKEQTFRIEKLVSICNSLDEKIKEPTDFVKKDIASIQSFDTMFAASIKAWAKIWKKTDIKIVGDRLAQKLVRLHIYHSMVTTSPHNVSIDFGIPARGLHGEAYRGHIFWDELYILPFYCMHFPEVAKSVLMYRYRRLEAARKYAKQHGYSGAMFPWQSGSNGKEETQVVHLNPISGEWGDDYSSLQRHISIAVAYNVWMYFNVTYDVSFINTYGGELFFEICRFWASKAKRNKTTGRFEIEEVMGPDEFHEKLPESEKGGLTNNAYTNIMVVWLFSKASSMLKHIDVTHKKALFGKIGLTDDEVDEWRVIQKNMALSISDDGIIEQFNGYFNLKELDWDAYEKKYGNIHRMDRILKAEGKSPDEYKVSKQADTLMTFYNIDPNTVTSIVEEIGYKLPKNYLEKNFDYYINRCSHGSTLSRVVHSYIASLIGKNELSWNLYIEALKSDYVDIQGGTTAEGIHMGVMTGTVLLSLTAYAGLNLKGETLAFNPNLPKHWREISFSCTFHGINFNVRVLSHHIILKANKNAKVLIGNKEYSLNADAEVKVAISNKA